MKKSFLLLAIAFSAVVANAQNAKHSLVWVNNQQDANVSQVFTGNDLPTKITPNILSSARTTGTTGGSRWYSYIDYLIKAGTLASPFNATFPYMWFRDNSLAVYSATPPATGIVYDSIALTSMGFVLDPFTAGFNDAAGYPGEIALEVGAGQAYTLDSVIIYGIYKRPKPSVKDTMRFSFFYGNGSSTSDIPGNHYFTGMTSRYGVDTLPFLEVKHDSLSNLPTGSTVVTTDVIMDANTAIDTTTSGVSIIRVAVPGGLSVPSGRNYVGATFAFKTGDASFTNLDTVLKDDGTGSGVIYKYNEFRPVVGYLPGSPIPFPPYHPWAVDGNTGQFKIVPNASWFGAYVPMWAWYSTSGGASSYQYPQVDFKITCSTCWLVDVPTVKNVISSVNAYPVPAVSEVNIPFTLSQKANVTVSLTNAIGQVVKTQSLTNVANGKVTFNVADLSAGVYVYSLQANGQRSIGRVVVAH